MRFFLLVVLFTAGCSLVENEDQEELDRNRQLWASQNIDDYQFDLDFGCFCLVTDYGTLTITVEDGEVVSIVPEFEPKDLQPFSERNRASDRRTIEDYFDLVEDIIDEAERWSVTYDPRFGFPAKISADY
ncbi:MAG: DUF6174 domain-containing protein, partial [Bacteroidota bacterium]